jgi:membrane protein required for colicin V production
MNNLPFNIVDMGVAGVLLISALLAFSRGLVREVLSIGAWVAAAVATIYGLPQFHDIARKYISVQLVADAVTGVTIFVVTLIVCAAISHRLARNVRGSGFGALDRSLGLLFGIARGAVLICLAYLAYIWAMPNAADQPEVVKQARSLPIIAEGADFLRKLLPVDALDKGAAAANAAKTQVEQQITDQMMQTMTQPAPKPAATKDDPGYNANERKDLDRLIQTQGNP